MKSSPLVLSLLVSALLNLTSTAQEPVQQGILEVGDRLHIQAVTPLRDVPGEVTVVKFGPRAWVLVEYSKAAAAPEGAPAPAGDAKQPDKVQLWINFEHVIAVEKLPTPEPKK